MADIFGNEEKQVDKGDGEFRYYPEFNETFISTSYSREYNELVKIKKQKAARNPGKRRKSTGRFVKAAAVSVAAVSVIAVAAVVISLFVQVLSFTAGQDFLDFRLEVTNPEDVPLAAALYDAQGQLQSETRLDGTELSFGSLVPESTYELRIFREDNGEVVFSDTYSTLKAEIPPDPSVTVISETVGVTTIDITFGVENADPSGLILLVDGSEAAGIADGDTLTLNAEDVGEGSTVRVEILSGDGRLRLFEKDYTTLIAPDLTVTLESVTTDVTGAAFTFDADDPYGHTVKASTDVGEHSLEYTDNGIVITVTGLGENTDFILTLNDGVTGGEVYSGTFRTDPESGAEVSVTNVFDDYYEISVIFTINNPFGHALTVLADGVTTDLGNADGSRLFRLNGLEEDTAYTLTVRDEHTGDVVCEETISTKATPLAEVTLKKLRIGTVYINLNFEVVNKGDHELSIAFDGEKKPFKDHVANFMPLEENSVHYVVITDEKYKKVIFSETYLTLEAGPASVTLTDSKVGYFDCELKFSVNNPLGHELKAFLDDKEINADFGGSSALVSLTELDENTSHTFKVRDTKTGSTVYSGGFTTEATPQAAVKLKNSATEPFAVSLTFEISNPYSHVLKMTADGKEIKCSESVSLTNLAPLSSHRVTVTDENVGKVIYDGTFKTKQAPAAEVRLKTSTSDAFSIKLAFEISNPYSHVLKMTADGKEIKCSENVSLTNLAPLSSHTVVVTDVDVGKVVYEGTFATKQAPPAEATLKKSVTDPFSIKLTFAFSNPHSHVLKMTADGKEIKCSENVSFTGLSPRTSRHVIITDETVGKVIYDGIFTTDSSVTLTQGDDMTVKCTFNEAFIAKYGACDLVLKAVIPKDPDYDEIWFDISEDQIHGSSHTSFIFEGKYTVSVMRWENDRTVVDSFTVSLNGIPDIAFDVAYRDGEVVFTKKSGRYPTLGKNERIEIEVDCDDGKTVTLVCGKDFGLNDKTVRTGRLSAYPLYYRILYYKYNSEWDYDDYICLIYGEFAEFID